MAQQEIKAEDNRHRIRAIVADDIQESLTLISSLIEEVCPCISIVAECNSLQSTKNAIDQYDPSLVFLDIQFSAEGKTAFDLLDLYEEDERTFEVIIFSGHCEAEYYDMAFKYNAVHFLPKPVEKERLRDAIRRVSICDEEADNQLEAEESVETLLIKTATASHFVATNDIVSIVSSNSYTYLTLANFQEIKSSRNIGYYDKQLSGNPEFIRIHSNTIVNINYVQGFSNKTERDVILIEPFPSLKSSRKGIKILIESLEELHT